MTRTRATSTGPDACRLLADSEKRALQHEAIAHIEVQRLIDYQHDLQDEATGTEYLLWLHREFCQRMPEELLWVANPETGERQRVVPGQLRQGWVQVGRHIPPGAEALPLFLKRFAECIHHRDCHGYDRWSHWAPLIIAYCGSILL